MLENGTAAGIDHFLVCSPATTVTQVHSINSFLASCAAAYPMCTAFGTLHPYAENVEADFQQLRSLQLRGVKLHPDFQNFPIDDPRAYPMYEMIQSSGLPILMHMGDAKSDFSHPYRLAMIFCGSSRNLRIIAAHFWRLGAVERGKRHFCSRMNGCGSIPAAACRFLPPEEISKAAVPTSGQRTASFGVDYPMWDYRKELERFFCIGTFGFGKSCKFFLKILRRFWANPTANFDNQRNFRECLSQKRKKAEYFS